MFQDVSDRCVLYKLCPLLLQCDISYSLRCAISLRVYFTGVCFIKYVLLCERVTYFIASFVKYVPGFISWVAKL